MQQIVSMSSFCFPVPLQQVSQVRVLSPFQQPGPY